MMSLFGNSVQPHDVITVLFCLLTISQAYVNVALNKPAAIYFRNEYHGVQNDASKAVDGRKSDQSWDGGQCALTWYRQTAILWVDLTTIHSIHHITIYFRTDNRPWGPSNYRTKFFLGFSVYVSNTTDRLQGTLCYKDDNFTLDTIPAVFTTTCPVHGQYVIYYNERLPGVTYPDGYSNTTSTELCEFEVYGCPDTGYFGSNCSLPCPDVTCQYCHIETGACQGCKLGYKGHRCEIACERGTYGAGCKETCGHCRDVKQCSNITGACLTGCNPGFKGDLCKTVCDRGYYGSECNERCGENCRYSDCFNINGTCRSSCYAGYQGNMCTPCKEGKYGAACEETCGHCRDVNQCSNKNGTCLTGCNAGFKGNLCKTACNRGSYGYDCNDTCGHCRDVDRCSLITGTCFTGCDAGYQGDLCKASCDSGSYGYDCNEICGHCRDVNQCSNINGTCLSGCDAAVYQGILCKTLCPVGYFGQDCSESCINSYTCDGCNDASGLCDYGCRPGLIGYFCQKNFKQGLTIVASNLINVY